MALVKSNVMKISTAYFFFAPGEPKTAPPAKADLGDIAKIEAAGYTHIGHTSIEQAIEVENEGGETSSDGSLQDPQLFTNVTVGSRAYVVKVWEWNSFNAKLALGSNAVVRADGSIGQNIAPTPTSGTLLVVFVTPSAPVYLHVPLTDAIGTGDMGAMGGRDSYGDLPIKFTEKTAAGQQARSFWLPLDKATGA